MELGEALGMGFAMWEVEENGISGAIQTPLGAAETGWRQTSAQTRATEKPRSALA